MIQNEKPRVNYLAVIPANVRYDTELTANAKLLYGEITALSNMTNACYACNGYFADLYKVKERAIGRWLNELEERGYIERWVGMHGKRFIRPILDNVAKARQLASYNQIMDEFGVTDYALRATLGEFLKHCKLNNRMPTNDKFMGIITELDFQFPHDDVAKVNSLKRAISGGYFDILRDCE